MEEESSSIKCAATNFKNKLTLFFLKDMNQLKTNLHSINPNPIDTSIKNQQEKLHPKTNTLRIIPKTIDTGSIQNRCTQHQRNQSTRHRFSFGWILRSENFHSSKHGSYPVILRGAEGEVAESIIQNLNLSYYLLFRWICFFGIGANRP